MTSLRSREDPPAGEVATTKPPAPPWWKSALVVLLLLAPAALGVLVAARMWSSSMRAMRVARQPKEIQALEAHFVSQGIDVEGVGAASGGRSNVTLAGTFRRDDEHAFALWRYDSPESARAARCATAECLVNGVYQLELVAWKGDHGALRNALLTLPSAF